MDHIIYLETLPRTKVTDMISITKSKGTDWASLFTDKNPVVYFHSFGTEYICQQVLNKTK